MLARCTLPLTVLIVNPLLHVAGASADNLLENPSFEAQGPLGPLVVQPGFVVGQSAAEGWFTKKNNYPGDLKTELVPSTLPGGGSLMLHVVAPTGAGIKQDFLPYQAGPDCATTALWVYVISGVVLTIPNDGGSAGSLLFSTTQGQWEQLMDGTSGCPTSLWILSYWSPAEFYVELASIEPVCGCDLDDSGEVDGGDLGLLLNHWGPCDACCREDFDGDGSVGGGDLGILLSTWGT